MPSLVRLVILLALSSSLWGADQSAAEIKLRETLRNTMLQLRTAQADRDTLQAEKAQWELEKQKLTAQEEAKMKESAAAEETSKARIEVLEAKESRKDLELTQLHELLEKWKAAQQQAASVAATKEAERARLAQRGVELQRRIDDQQAKNFAMYKIGLEILGKYEGFGLGTALGAREPFIGTTRVRLENLIQDGRDKLQEQRLTPTAGASTAKPAAEPSIPSRATPPETRRKPEKKG